MSIYLSIGTNQGDKKENIRKALCYLNDFCKILKISRFYRTKPYGYTNQKRFINFAIEVESNLTPVEFLKKCQSIEELLGRKRLIKWGPRTIDIDILFWNNEIINIKELNIPHYDLHNREFVLKPMLDIAPEFIHPIFRKSIVEMYQELKQK
ncbi:MAG: 2-amino-4-hydroxy-6-hydroxymethyldihydropteridine diphosphokinase [Brevinematales bacterium]|nr:2-amino-4-hydroxy-6-hydroxymethyldihydropteridine diphosphokinase [Brevinematales bacterium]